MKRVAILLALLLFGSSSAVAAPKPVAVKKLAITAVDKGTERLVLSGKSLVLVSNSDGINSNILLTGLDASGSQLWQKTIDTGVDEVALTAASDSLGNIWLAGAASAVVSIDTSTAPLQAENPDGVVIEPVTKLRGDMNVLTIWKISPIGDLLTTYSLPLNAPALINAISVNSTGVSIVGVLQEKPLIVSMNSQGAFGKVITIGTSKTTLNALVRNSDGSLSIFGSSSENLGGKKVAGARDGILLKITKTGSLGTVVRSSAPKADRSWLVADSSLALTGYVKTGRVTETAFTKFSSVFAPQWTLRVPSLGASAIVSGGGATYGAFNSNSAVTGVAGWKPGSASLLLLSFDSKGAITAANGSTELSELISLSYSKELGVIGLARSSDQSVYLFKIV